MVSGGVISDCHVHLTEGLQSIQRSGGKVYGQSGVISNCHVHLDLTKGLQWCDMFHGSYTVREGDAREARCWITLFAGLQSQQHRGIPAT
jgi:hypothetical protein